MTYAMAMLLAEVAARLHPSPKIIIFGTDDDEDALTLARAGRYPAAAALGMDPGLRANYTVDEGEAIRVSEALRELCLFSRHKLTRDTPMARMDLVICHRVFDGIAAARRPRLIDELYHSLRDGGLLLALDHGDRFPADRFDRLEGGLLRARPSHGLESPAFRPSASRQAVLRPVVPCSARPCGSGLSSSEPGSTGSLLHIMGVPLLLWDSRLRLLFASPEATAAFGLSAADIGSGIDVLAGRLPGGAELLLATRRAVATCRAAATQATEEVSIRGPGRVYLARISAAAAGTSILFSDVTSLEIAHRHAVTQLQQESAIARISALALAPAEPEALCGEALAVLLANLPACSGGLIVAVGGDDEDVEVLASHGLGEEPLRTLHTLGEPSMTCSIMDEGRLLGVIGLFGRRPGPGEGQGEHWLRSIARVLGGAIGRQRTRRQLALELEVSTLLAGAPSLEAVGRGLKRAFGVLPAVEVAEIWSRRSSIGSDWQRLVPEAGGETDAAAPNWPAELCTRFKDGTVQVWSDGPRRELLVALVRRDAPLAVLRLAGRGLRRPDAELGVGLRRVARMLAGFLERSSILERSRRNEAALREADQQKDDFLAMLGHELRNPMAAIRNATELLSRIDHPTPQLLRLQNIFDRQTLQTTKLIDGLLDIARVARGKVELQVAPVQVPELVRQAVDDRRQQFEQREVELRLPPSDDLWVEADRVRLVQILDNLISNAIKFTAPNGRIRLGVERCSSRGVIRVADDGQGIDAELMPQIFEPFRQGRATTARARAGLGLGLALVKGLVDLHGFQLRAASPGVGGGATFEIEFALSEAPESRLPESRVEMRALELLLVEDNVDVAETLGELLAAAGHRVATVGSAELALEHLRQRRPDIVLCDLGLPGMDGLELAARLRAEPEHAGLRLVAMTGFGDASTQSRAEQAGFDHMLVKPVQLDALRHCLTRVAAAPSRRVGRG
jgi:signal transduction histidine kinase/CheY-like chemotaxis protein/SAM-dependent methyltransferase